MMDIYKATIDLGNTQVLSDFLDQLEYTDHLYRLECDGRLYHTGDSSNTFGSDKELHLREPVKHIGDQVLEHVKTWKGKDNYAIMHLWSNHMGPGGTGAVHQHAHFPLTYIVYTHMTHDEMGLLYLVDEDGEEQDITVRTGDLLIFSGAIKHGIRENKSQELRVSLAGHIVSTV